MKLAVVVLLLFSNLSLAQGNGTSGKEFVMSCTYGVLAGTLVGAATLAFEDQPGDNLNKVARGASLGLYAGILLGFYVVYGVSDDEPEYDQYIEQGLPPVEGEGTRLRSQPKFQIGVVPLFDDDTTSISGASAQLQFNLF